MSDSQGISIVVTFFNDSFFLQKNLPSCLSQEVEKEILIVDDCSSEPLNLGAEKIIKNNNLKVIRHEINKGLSAARNTAISQSKYDLIICVDADDYLYPCVLKRLLFEMTSDYDVISGMCTDNGNLYNPWPKNNILDRSVFLDHNPLVCSSLFRKEIWRRAGRYLENPHTHYEDYNFWAKIHAIGGRFKFLNDLVIYEHTNRPDSMLKTLHSKTSFFKSLAISGLDYKETK